jgi:uncharacterized protein
MIKPMNTKQRNKTCVIYLAIVLGVCYLLGILEAAMDSGVFYQILGIGFTFIPVIAALITKRITGEKAKYHLSLRVWKNMKYWLLSALMPGILIAMGATIYYLIFPEQYSGVFQIGTRLGTDSEIAVGNPIMLILACIAFSAIMIPIQLLELGEEIGWRGYLLGFQVEKYGEKKAALINGIEWGLAHLPLVYFGFNYSLENRGAPWSNMAMMMLVCVVLGILLSYVTLKTGNCMYAAIMHGVINVIGELPVYLSKNISNGLLGPNPTGLLTMLPLILAAILCFWKLKNKMGLQGSLN